MRRNRCPPFPAETTKCSTHEGPTSSQKIYNNSSTPSHRPALPVRDCAPPRAATPEYSLVTPPPGTPPDPGQHLPFRARRTLNAPRSSPAATPRASRPLSSPAVRICLRPWPMSLHQRLVPSPSVTTGERHAPSPSLVALTLSPALVRTLAMLRDTKSDTTLPILARHSPPRAPPAYHLSQTHPKYQTANPNAPLLHTNPNTSTPC